MSYMPKEITDALKGGFGRWRRDFRLQGTPKFFLDGDWWDRQEKRIWKVCREKLKI